MIEKNTEVHDSNKLINEKIVILSSIFKYKIDASEESKKPMSSIPIEDHEQKEDIGQKSIDGENSETTEQVWDEVDRLIIELYYPRKQDKNNHCTETKLCVNKQKTFQQRGTNSSKEVLKPLRNCT